MKKANIDELKLSDVRPGVTRRSFSGAGATLAWGTLSPGHEPMVDLSVFNPRRDDYYAIDEGDSGA